MSTNLSSQFRPSIVKLVEHERVRLGLTKAKLAQKLGYVNVAKGCRRYDRFLEGQIEQPFLLAHIADAISITPDRLGEILKKSRLEIKEQERLQAEKEELDWRNNFRPHGIFETERDVPRPIFAAIIMGTEKMKYVQFDNLQEPLSFCSQMMTEIINRNKNYRGEIPCFGKITGFTINYTPDRAVTFDLFGKPIEKLTKAKRLGHGVLSVGGRVIPPNLIKNQKDI